MEIINPLHLNVLNAPLAAAADHLRIDLRVLRRESAYWRDGALSDFALCEGVRVAVDLRSASEPHALFAFFHEGRPRLQRVELSLAPIGARRRPLFLCSVDGPVEVLAWRGGRFASIKAQRLAHSSAWRRASTQGAPSPRPPRVSEAALAPCVLGHDLQDRTPFPQA